ncbi:Sterile alpha motif domain-containing protein 9-like [Labeo rohita]|uniref:Sterile alpha motif domain-containing protein 9-like n=1 Tax=Labeo rohita TaxID=84645 RepID=A0ABQ8L027_LABRO|nr:Sterile alpha motif domain-containing protein 9-like [Labeo rohita]
MLRHTEEMKKHVQKDRKSSSTRLLSFLALINSYVPGSHRSKLFCEEFMDQTEQPTDEGNPTLETIMKPFMDLIVISSEEDQKANYIRLAHPMIAHACLKMLTEHKVTRFDIAQDFLNSLVNGKESNSGQICKSMLVTRLEHLFKKEKFSKLILDIMDESENTVEQCICLLKLASDLFFTDPFYPQTLARLYYIEVKEGNKYEEARKWAEEAIKRDPKNSHIRDTLEQVHKTHLLNETKKPSSDINVRLAIARSAIKAFKEEEEAAEDEAEDNTKFNNRGLFGFLQVCKIIHPKTSLNRTPLEHTEQEYSKFISSLRGDVETKYDFFEWYLAFSRQSFEKEDPDYIHTEPAITNLPNLEQCLRKMRHSYKSKYQKYLRGRYLLPLFFLAKQKGLQRLIYTSKLSQTDLERLTEGDGSEEIKDLQRINGQVRDHKVFAITGQKQIQVTPHDPASVCKQGQVSFYLGFNIREPVAYNIRYKDSKLHSIVLHNSADSF